MTLVSAVNPSDRRPRLEPILNGISAALNRLLATDERALAQLQGLAGRTLAVKLRRLEWVLYLHVSETGVRFASQTGQIPDVRLEGYVSDLLAMVKAQKVGQPFAAGRVEIQGDLAAVQQLQASLNQLNVDWEELLSQYLGPIAAHQLGRVLRAGSSWASKTRQTLEQDLSEYLQHEVRLLPTAAEVEEFLGNSVAFAADVDRLAARIMRLQRKDRP